MNWKYRRSQKLIALFLFGFSVFYLVSGLKYKVGTHKILGPGFMPLAIGLLLSACSAFHLIRALREKEPGQKAEETAMEKGRNYGAIMGILACTTAYPLILGYLKFVSSTFLVGLAMLLLLKPKSIIFSVILALVLALGCFLLFSRLFGVALPSGPLEDLLFRIGA
jgi:hypothetical protein